MEGKGEDRRRACRNVFNSGQVEKARVDASGLVYRGVESWNV